jgi:hypothetical protein
LNVSSEIWRPAPLGSRPWAFPLNKTKTNERMEITLLAFVVVGTLVRISGLIRLRSDLRLAHAPELAVCPVDGPPLAATGAHVRPNGNDLTWVSWDFARPDAVLVAYEARVDRLELAAGARTGLTGRGPWVFNFQLPGRRNLARRSTAVPAPVEQVDARWN